MRDIGVGLACVVGLVVVLVLFGQVFHSASQAPTHAMETARLRADLAAMKAELEKTRTELEKVRGDWKKASDDNQDLRRKVGELERTVRKNGASPGTR